MKLHKRIISALLCAALTALPLTACNQKQPPAETASMGRYVERMWALPPVEPGTDIHVAHLRPDGQIGVLAQVLAEPGAEQGAGMRYFAASDGKSWREESPAWLKQLGDVAIDVMNLHFNTKGEGVAVYWGKQVDGGGEQRYRVALIKPDGTIADTAIGGADPWENGDAMLYSIPRESGESAGESDVAADAEKSGAEAPVGEGVPAGEDAPAEESGAMPLFIRSAAMGEDGMVYIETQFSGCGRFDPATGALTASYLAESSAMALAGDEVVQLLTVDAAGRAGQNVNAYSLFYSDAKTGEIKRTVPAESLRFTTGVTMASGRDGAVYITDASGLYRVAPGGESLELILDGALCSLSMPSIGASCVIPHGENEFFIPFSGNYGKDGAPQLANLVYSEDTPTLPDSELTVFSMTGNSTLSQAVGVFRKKYPNTLVNIRTAEDGENGDDARKALNTELLAGSGPDLFLLKDLPVESYIEKGVLADLTPTLKPMLEADSILPAAAKAYARDGGIYAIPTRVNLPTLWGGEEAVAAANSLDTLLDYARKNPGKRIFGDMTPENLLYQLMPGQWDGLLTEQGVDVDAAEKLITTLTALSKTADAPHVYDYFGSDEYRAESGDGNPGNGWENAGYTQPEDFYAVSNNRAELMPALLKGFRSIGQPNGVINKRIGGMTWDATGEGDWNSDLPENIVDKIFRPFPEGGWYEPACVVGVNAASAQQELAMAFVEAMLSVETQKADLDDGFPVNREAIASNVERRETWYMSNSYNSVSDESSGEPEGADMFRELTLEYAWPSKAMLQAVANRLGEIEKPMQRNYSLGILYGMQENLPRAVQMAVAGESTPRAAAEWLREELRLVIEEA